MEGTEYAEEPLCVRIAEIAPPAAVLIPNVIARMATCREKDGSPRMDCLNNKEPSGLYVASLTDEGRYRLLVEAVTDYAIYMLDVNGIVTSWNRCSTLQGI
jgi:hypothetical protein